MAVKVREILNEYEIEEILTEYLGAFDSMLQIIDTVNGANSSAIIYSIAETAKANNLKPFDYFEYLLTEIPKHVDDKNTDFLAELLPWSDMLPENIRKPQKASGK